MFANKFAGAVFPRDHGGYVVRGIGASRFKQTVGKAETCGGYSLPGSGDVWIVEGAVDAMSVKAIHADAHVLATLGASGLPWEQVRREIPAGRRVIVALDPADAGAIGSERLIKELESAKIDVERKTSVRKDWNADLQEGFAAVDKRWLPERQADALLSEKAQEPTKKPKKPNNSGPSF